MRDYIIAFDIDGETWTETDKHDSAEVAKAYAHVRVQMILAERKPRRASAAISVEGDERLGAWTYDRERDDALNWADA